MPLCTTSTSLPHLLILKLGTLLVLSKTRLHTNFQLKTPRHVTCRIHPSLMQKLVFEPHLHTWHNQLLPCTQHCYLTLPAPVRHERSTRTSPSARGHHPSMPSVCNWHALGMPTTTPVAWPSGRLAPCAPRALPPCPRASPPSQHDTSPPRCHAARRNHREAPTI